MVWFEIDPCRLWKISSMGIWETGKTVFVRTRALYAGVPVVLFTISYLQEIR
jgi:hypothetical protein